MEVLQAPLEARGRRRPNSPFRSSTPHSLCDSHRPVSRGVLQDVGKQPPTTGASSAAVAVDGDPHRAALINHNPQRIVPTTTQDLWAMARTCLPFLNPGRGRAGVAMPGDLTLVIVALISTVGVIAAALITGLATVIAAWLQSRGGPR